MANFFSFDSGYQYEPVIRQVDAKVVDKDLAQIRCKILSSINRLYDQKDLSRSELALTARISRAVAVKFHRGMPTKFPPIDCCASPGGLGSRRVLVLQSNLESSAFGDAGLGLRGIENTDSKMVIYRCYWHLDAPIFYELDNV